MALFTTTEFASYVQQPAVNEDTVTLLLELVTGLMEEAYGAVLPDPGTSAMRRIGLEATKRAYLNPNGYVQETLPDGYSYNRGGVYSAQTDNGVYLTAAERRALVAASGRATVRSYKLVNSFGTSGTLDDV